VIDKISFKTGQAVKFMTETSTELNRFEVHRKLTSKLLAPNTSDEAESEFDLSSRICSVAPTVLPLTLQIPIKQIATGLHHSGL